MKVMVELQSGVVRTFTDHMEIIGLDPMIVIHIDSNGKQVKIGNFRRIYTKKN